MTVGCNTTLRHGYSAHLLSPLWLGLTSQAFPLSAEPSPRAPLVQQDTRALHRTPVRGSPPALLTVFPTLEILCYSEWNRRNYLTTSAQTFSLYLRISLKALSFSKTNYITIRNKLLFISTLPHPSPELKSADWPRHLNVAAMKGRKKYRSNGGAVSKMLTFSFFVNFRFSFLSYSYWRKIFNFHMVFLFL